MPVEFWDSPIDETFLVVQGYQGRLNDQWQQTRLIMYTVASTVTEADKRGEVYDMFFIPGDPTVQERKEKKQHDYSSMVKRNKEFTEQVRKEMAAGKL